MDLDLRDNVQRTIYFTGWYERPYLNVFCDRLTKGDCFLDVGAHAGTHTLAVSQALESLGGGTVIAFEPASDMASRLKNIVRQNRLQNIIIIDSALGAEVGVAELRGGPEHFHEADAGVRSFFGPGNAVEEVKVIPFDTWAVDNALSALDLVKIDVEGAELEVLKGMARSIECLQPRLIGVEINDSILERAGVTRREIHSLLAQFGYQPLRKRDLQSNFLFAPESSQTSSNHH